MSESFRVLWAFLGTPPHIQCILMEHLNVQYYFRYATRAYERWTSSSLNKRKRKVGTTDDAASWMAIAGKALFALFRGFDVGFEQLMQMGRSSSIPTLGDDLPACFAVSQNLGNPEHLDPDA